MELDKKDKRDPEHSEPPATNPLTSGATFTESDVESLLRRYGQALRAEEQKPAPISDEEFAKIKERVELLAAAPSWSILSNF